MRRRTLSTAHLCLIRKKYSGSERVLQIDTGRRIARSVGPNLRDAGMERLFQNKWQNGLTNSKEGCVYGIPLGAETVLRIDTGASKDGGEPQVTTWQLPQPSKTLEKWEGGVLARNGIMYCMPNNHKAVLQIVPPGVPSREPLHQARDEREQRRERAREAREQRRREETDKKKAEKEEKRRERLGRKRHEDASGGGAGAAATEEEKKEGSPTRRGARATRTADAILTDAAATEDGLAFDYKSGIPTLRSSAHRVKCALDRRRHDPTPTGTTAHLPNAIRAEEYLSYSTRAYNFHDAVAALLRRCDAELVGAFRSSAEGPAVVPTLDRFVVPPRSLLRKCQKGQLERAQAYLSDRVAADAPFLDVFDRFVVNEVLPHFKRRLEAAGAHESGQPLSFCYQRPPTLRIQPGPARALVRAHNDAEYGRELLFDTIP